PAAPRRPLSRQQADRGETPYREEGTAGHPALAAAHAWAGIPACLQSGSYRVLTCPRRLHQEPIQGAVPDQGGCALNQSVRGDRVYWTSVVNPPQPFAGVIVDVYEVPALAARRAARAPVVGAW